MSQPGGKPSSSDQLGPSASSTTTPESSAPVKQPQQPFDADHPLLQWGSPLSAVDRTILLASLNPLTKTPDPLPYIVFTPPPAGVDLTPIKPRLEDPSIAEEVQGTPGVQQTTSKPPTNTLHWNPGLPPPATSSKPPSGTDSIPPLPLGTDPKQSTRTNPQSPPPPGSGPQQFATPPKTPGSVKPTEQAETIHIYRHAEGLHNVLARGGQIRDPYLTTLGLSQCAQIQRNTLAELPDIIISSPLKRTIQTAVLCFTPAIDKRDKMVHLVPELSEIGYHPCNQVSDRVALEKEFGGMIDATRVPDKSPLLPGNKAEFEKRAVAARAAIKKVIDDYRELHSHKGHLNVIVVTHGAFINYLIGKPNEQGIWANTGHRSYIFTVTAKADQAPRLLETTESIKERTGPPGSAGKEREQHLQKAYVNRVLATAEPRSVSFDA
ncbi:histidine phosphatase superfamily [Rostrohypoxylon terebratum]|nr:histidine phosphatase superfamily [Rostrohypoxylon terebratum]